MPVIQRILDGLTESVHVVGVAWQERLKHADITSGVFHGISGSVNSPKRADLRERHASPCVPAYQPHIPGIQALRVGMSECQVSLGDARQS